MFNNLINAIHPYSKEVWLSCVIYFVTLIEQGADESILNLIYDENHNFRREYEISLIRELFSEGYNENQIKICLKYCNQKDAIYFIIETLAKLDLPESILSKIPNVEKIPDNLLSRNDIEFLGRTYQNSQIDDEQFLYCLKYINLDLDGFKNIVLSVISELDKKQIDDIYLMIRQGNSFTKVRDQVLKYVLEKLSRYVNLSILSEDEREDLEDFILSFKKFDNVLNYYKKLVSRKLVDSRT